MDEIVSRLTIELDATGNIAISGDYDLGDLCLFEVFLRRYIYRAMDDMGEGELERIEARAN